MVWTWGEVPRAEQGTEPRQLERRRPCIWGFAAAFGAASERHVDTGAAAELT